MTEKNEMHKRRADAVVATAFANANEFRDDFCAWVVDNAHVYLEFEAQALLVAGRRKHYGARTIMEVVRHNSLVSEAGGEWKINKNRTPDCARLFSILNPRHANLFSFRESYDRLNRHMSSRCGKKAA